MKQTRQNPASKDNQETTEDSFLILHNDNFHTFEYVTHALIEVCNHSFEQASQCTLITHYKGKCDVKKGGIKALKPMKEALNERELNATID